MSPTGGRIRFINHQDKEFITVTGAFCGLRKKNGNLCEILPVLLTGSVNQQHGISPLPKTLLFSRFTKAKWQRGNSHLLTVI